MTAPAPSVASTNRERVALVLQGGGALGAYQGGVYEGLAAAGYEPDWIAGISIGAANAAIIAGNPPERRVARLRDFWETVSSCVNLPVTPVEPPWRMFFNYFGSWAATMFGQPGFFRPRMPPYWAWPAGTEGATSVYDTSLFRATLERLVDFDLINAGEVRLSIGAVNVETGNFAYFDNGERRIGPEHVMASGALPPGFPAVRIADGIDDGYFWDGGLVSNTPLKVVLDHVPQLHDLIFQVDLFSARGALPRDMDEVMERQKDIVYSSRTRHGTTEVRIEQLLRNAMVKLAEYVPEAHRRDPEVESLLRLGRQTSLSIVHLIYRAKLHEGQAKDYEFSRASMEDHWQAGREDARCAVARAGWREPPAPGENVRIFDYGRPDKPL